ncbi:2-phospho-L-lactate transferase [Methanotrichaceae archaeon M04Ac]|uniref:2-phospho-L-lactate transferase n=1 Tax=Candidatus Methanocrinis alkalitolerans TaxID=3033395 RepID=A0ABT5XG23_9EURY|nr:2-phospho-L-lactate transferase [Candidatus Methanocrinis alkalitolerans]MDF0593612.1 2-phospho-L-lactate transferase [Candidatus Methanocrinis alkalitolerans]
MVLSGGTGTPKLLAGLQKVLPPSEVTVVANTADDLWISGNLVSPDLDTIVYTLVGMIDRRKWWGIEKDSFNTHNFLKSLGHQEILALGDLDRAVHIFRSDLLREGFSLSEATQRLCRALKVEEKVVPMTDDPVSTVISTPEGEMDLQEFWVGRGGRPEVTGVRYRGIGEARPSPEFIAALKKAAEKGEPVLIGPSNPVSSIGPILALRGVRDLLGGCEVKIPVVAVSPLVGGRPVSGPAAKFMRARGYPVTDGGVAEILGCVDLMVVSPGSDYLGPSVRLNTVMKDEAESLRLAKEIVDILDGKVEKEAEAV